MRRLYILSALLTVLPLPAAAQQGDSLTLGKVFLPIGSSVPRELTSSSSASYDAKVLERYPTIDLMNSFTGVIPGLWVTENKGATGVKYGSPNSSLRIRYNSSVRYIIDDIAVEDPSQIQLNPEEIESITLVSDILDKVKFGPQAAQGAVYIRTLRGTESGRVFKVGYEHGLDVVDRMPQWCSGVDYARLNNAARQNYNTLVGDNTYQILFNDDAIRSFGLCDNMDQAFPNVDYKSLMLKNTRNFNKAYALVRGGGGGLDYSANLGYVNQDDIYKLGAQSDYNRFNAKMNIGIRINRKLRAEFSFIGTYSIRRSPMSSYSAQTNTYEFPTVWERIRNTPPVEYPLMLWEDEETQKTVYPLSISYPDHPYASVTETGSYKETFRVGVTKAVLKYDLSALLKGLESESQVSYNIAYGARMGQAYDYIGYIFNKGTGETNITDHQGASSSSASTYLTEHVQGLQFHEKLKYAWTSGGHRVDASAVYYLSKLANSSQDEYHIQQNGIFSGSYSFGNKYLIDLAANYAGTSARRKGNRYKLFPAVGIGWVATNEDFLSGQRWLDYLKFRAQAGAIGYEIFSSQFLWESYHAKTSSMTFGPYTQGTQWFGSSTYSTTGAYTKRLANEDLGWETMKECVFGFDAVLAGKLSLSYTHYDSIDDGIVQDVASVLPLFYGASSLYENYNSIHYWGDELTISWSGRSGDFAYTLGGSALSSRGRYLKYNESTTYDNLRHEGTYVNDVFGYDYIGKYSSVQDIAASPAQQFDAAVYPGDLKYADVTGDNVIDSNDRKVIGNTSARLQYALNVHLEYKNLDLSIVGTGKAFRDVFLNNEYYWNGWGDGNCSVWVRDNVETGVYPRLSYVKSSNNFRNSQYWMVPGGFFKIQSVELGYDLDLRRTGRATGLDGIRLYLRGANLLTISGIKDCDPESMSSGVSDYPLFRTFSAGIKFTL